MKQETEAHNMICTECHKKAPQLFGPYWRNDIVKGEITIIEKHEQICIECAVKRDGFLGLVTKTHDKPK